MKNSLAGNTTYTIFFFLQMSPGELLETFGYDKSMGLENVKFVQRKNVFFFMSIVIDLEWGI